LPISKEHKCASVDLKGERKCAGCGVVLSNVGWNRWKDRCTKCFKKKWEGKYRQVRLEIKSDFGGKCERCDYSGCTRALCFHHRYGRKVGEKSGGVKISEVRKHPERFVLLCANCHTEEHCNYGCATHRNANETEKHGEPVLGAK
jgi:hypothetical protein